MSCDRWRPLLVHAADDGLDALSAGDRDALTQHLERCAECQAAFDDQRTVRAALRARVDASVPTGFAERVRARIKLDEASEPGVSWVDVLRWRTWSFRLAPVAAGLLLFGVVTARSATGSVPAEEAAPGLSDLTESWAFGGQEPEERPAFTVWGQGDVGGETLLDAILRAEPDEPLMSGDAS